MISKNNVLVEKRIFLNAENYYTIIYFRNMNIMIVHKINKQINKTHSKKSIWSALLLFILDRLLKKSSG